MVELKIKCESLQEAQMYLNAPQYLGLIQDFREALRSATKHGEPVDVLRVVEQFVPDLAKACDHAEGAY